MATSNTLRFLQNQANASPTPTDLLLPVFGGEVIAAFEEYNQFLPLVNYKSMTSGKDMKFPAVWKIGSEYHEAGTELLGMDVDTKEYTISLDDRPLVSHFEVDDIDVSLAHYDIRSELAMECGREMARQMDRKIAALLLNAAATAADTGSNNFPIGGDSYTAYDNSADFTATFDTEQDAANLIEAIGDISRRMDEKDIPAPDRACVVKVGLYYALRKLGLPYYTSPSVVYPAGGAVFGNNQYGSAGPAIQDGQGYQRAIDVMGVPVYSSNHLPTATISTGPAKYQVANGDKVGGVMFHKSAIGVCQLAGITSESFRDVRRQSDFFVAKMFMGGGGLRPYAAYRIGKN